MSSYTEFDDTLNVCHSAMITDLIDDGHEYYMVMEPFTYYVGGLDTETYVHIPKGYITDMASVPRLMYTLFEPWGDYAKACVVHDYLCEYGEVMTFLGRTPVTRKNADHIFLEAMTVLNVPKWKRNMLYAAVRSYSMTLGRKHKPKKYQLKQRLEKIITAYHNKHGKLPRKEYVVAALANDKQ